MQGWEVSSPKCLVCEWVGGVNAVTGRGVGMGVQASSIARTAFPGIRGPMEGVTSIQCDWRSGSVQHVRRQACSLLWAGRRLRAVTTPAGRGEACGGRDRQGGVGGAAGGAPVPSFPALSSPPAAAAQSLCPDFRGPRNGPRRTCCPPAHEGFYWDWVAHVAGLGPVTPPKGQFILGKRHDDCGSKREALNTNRRV